MTTPVTPAAPSPFTLDPVTYAQRRRRAALEFFLGFIGVAALVIITVTATAATGEGYWTDWWAIAGLGVGIGVRSRNSLTWIISLITGLGASTAILYSGVPAVPALLSGLSIGVATAVAVRILRGRSNRRPRLASRQALVTIFVSAIASGLTIAALASVIGLIGNLGSDAVSLALRSAAEMAAGVLLIAPLAMRVPHPRDTAGMAESVLQWIVSLAVVIVIFGISTGLPLAYLAIAPLVWGAIRLTFRMAMTQLVVVATLTSILSALGRGPFSLAMHGTDLSGILVQSFDVTIAVVFVTLGSVVTTRKLLSEELDKSQASERENDRQELERAAEVQRALLPRDRFPAAGYEFAGVCIPTRSVGGDFYDWQSIPHGFALTLGDVMGKGVGAGMLAATARTALRMSEGSADASDVVDHASRVLEPDLAQSSSFVTLFHARVSAVDGSFSYSDAGHGLSFILDADGDMHRLRSTDLPLGVSMGEARTSVASMLHPGELLVSLSDGVLDLWDGTLDSIVQVAAIARAASSPQELVDMISDLAQKSSAPDDITIVAVRRDR